MEVKSTPLISIVIPSYKHGHLIGRALESVLNQTYNNWEAIVVDNHSLDGTDEAVLAYRDPRIKLFKIHNEGIIAVSRNYGIKAAQGEWIAFLDSDDWWTTDKLHCCLPYLNSDGGADIIYHHLSIVRNNVRRKLGDIIISSLPRQPVFVQLLCSGLSIPNSSVIVRRKLLEQIGGVSERREIISVEDYDTWIRLSLITEKFIRIPKFLGFYWAGDSNNSTASPKQIRNITELYSQYLDKLSAEDRSRAEGFLAYRIGRIAYNYGNHEISIKNFKKALSHPISNSTRAKAVYFLLISSFLNTFNETS